MQNLLNNNKNNNEQFLNKNKKIDFAQQNVGKNYREHDNADEEHKEQQMENINN